jgi:hypothetical protein
MRRHMRLITIVCLIASAWPIAACGGQAISSADQIATRVAQDLAVAATLTAVARAQPTAALPNAATPEPTAIPSSAPPTEAPLPTETPPAPTDIPVPPTAPPEPTEAPIAYTDVNFSGNPVPGEEVGGHIQIAGAQLNDNNVPVVHSFLAIRVFARFPASAAHDGDGVEQVRIVLTNDETGEIVQDRPEQTAGYCAFQGGEPDCVLWVFAEHDNKWPKGQPITDGTYRVDVTITPRAENNPTVNWNFQFEVAQS